MEDYVMIWYEPPVLCAAAMRSNSVLTHRLFLALAALAHDRGNFRGRSEEDYFCLFDGHGGKDASLFACENLHFQVGLTLPMTSFSLSLSFALGSEVAHRLHDLVV
jgi:hypothetical protein